MLENGVQNPFDDDQLSFLSLKNNDGQYSLWPEFKDIPKGWTLTFGPASREDCLSHITQNWTRPLTAVDQ